MGSFQGIYALYNLEKLSKHIFEIETITYYIAAVISLITCTGDRRAIKVEID
jgi:hypothetical protein